MVREAGRLPPAGDVQSRPRRATCSEAYCLKHSSRGVAGLAKKRPRRFALGVESPPDFGMGHRYLARISKLVRLIIAAPLTGGTVRTKRADVIVPSSPCDAVPRVTRSQQLTPLIGGRYERAVKQFTGNSAWGCCSFNSAQTDS